MKGTALERALEAERDRDGFSTEQRNALWKGIEHSIGLAAAAPKPDAPKPDAPAPSPPSSALPAATGGFGALKIGALVAVAALAGAGVGALAHAQWAGPRTVIVERPASTSTPVETAAPVLSAAASAPALAPPLSAQAATTTAPAIPPSRSTTPTPVATPAPLAPATSAAASAASAPAKDAALARERTLLDMARTALSRGEASSALATLDSHAREFPKSQLGEEREILAIQSLAAANRLPEARLRANAFKTNYPKSALLGVVDEAVQ